MQAKKFSLKLTRLTDNASRLVKIPPGTQDGAASGGVHDKRREFMRTPEQLPDPWLFTTEKLLRELDRCREMVLLIPAPTHEAHFAINIAVNAIWNLTQHLRYMLLLQREGQTAFGKRAETQHKARKVPTGTLPRAGSKDARTVAGKASGKVVRLPNAASA